MKWRTPISQQCVFSQSAVSGLFRQIWSSGLQAHRTHRPHGTSVLCACEQHSKRHSHWQARTDSSQHRTALVSQLVRDKDKNTSVRAIAVTARTQPSPAHLHSLTTTLTTIPLPLHSTRLHIIHHTTPAASSHSSSLSSHRRDGRLRRSPCFHTLSTLAVPLVARCCCRSKGWLLLSPCSSLFRC